MATDERPWRRDFWLGEVDPRPIALFRIGYALLILFDFVDRLEGFHTFYTDAGMLPRAATPSGLHPWLFDLTGAALGVGILWTIGVVAATCLLIGWRTRLASVVTFLLVVSIYWRNTMVVDGSDTLRCALGFWLMFVDAGASFSLDVRSRRRPSLSSIPAGPVRLVQLQVAFVYLMAGLSKHGPSWLDGTAVWYALQSSDFARPLGHLVATAPRLCALLTWATLLLECGFPLLVFAGRARLRAFALVGVLGLHASIYLTMRLGLFPATMMVCVLPFLLPEWLDKVAPLRLATPHQPGLRRPARERRLLAVELTLLATAVLSQLPLQQTALTAMRATQALGIEQGWSLFAPDPVRVRIRWSAPGTLVDGSTVDVLAEAAPRLQHDPSHWFSRWDKLRAGLLQGSDWRISRLSAFLCRRWNSDHPTRPLAELRLTVSVTPFGPPGQPDGAEKVAVLTQQPCR